MIRFGPAAAPKWFDQRMDLLESYFDHVVAHGASSIEFVVHGGRPGEEAERVHLSRPNWSPAVAAAQSRGLEVHLHAPLTPKHRIGRWAAERIALAELFTPIVDFLLEIEAGQTRPPVLVLHGATVPETSNLSGEAVTAEFVTWMAHEIQNRSSNAQMAIELRLRAVGQSERFDHQISALTEFVSGLEIPALGICWDIANHLASHEVGPLPSETELRYINHIHLHDRHPTGGGLHAPLGTTGLPWKAAIRSLQDAGWSGAVTLEIRYRYALDRGQPWNVLGASLDRLSSLLRGE